MSAEQQINPTPLSRQDLEVLAFTLSGLLKNELDKPMSAKETYLWMGIGKTKFNRMVAKGIIKGHLKEHGDPMYVRSEIIDLIKRS